MVDCNASWYHGDISSDTASLLCSQVGQNGAFLLRKSGRFSDTLVLSFLYDGTVYHHRISVRDNQRAFYMESSKKSFSSLDDLVNFYSIPRPPFPQPLIFPISNKPDPDFTRTQFAGMSIYECDIMPGGIHRPIIPTPIPTPKKPNTTTSTTTGRQLPLLPPRMDHSSRPDDEEWPEPPPCLSGSLPDVKPKLKPKPKPKPGKRDDSTSKNRLSWVLPESSFQSFMEGLDELRSKRRNVRRNSSPNVLDDDNNNENSSMKPSVTKQRARTICAPLKSETTISSQKHHTKLTRAPSKSNKGSSISGTLRRLLPFHHIFSHEGKDTQNNNTNSDTEEDYAPIICKTRFVATDDYYGQEGAMEFKKGNIFVLKGVRIDGWWYCYNKTTKQSGWVLQEKLKAFSNENWFEAKQVKTESDYEIYYKSADCDDDFDEFEDQNYCSYLIPASIESSGTIQSASEDTTT